MSQLKIKITGSGTEEEIISALEDVIKSIKDPDNDYEKGEQWEDATLYTEMSVDDDEIDE